MVLMSCVCNNNNKVYRKSRDIYDSRKQINYHNVHIFIACSNE